VLADTLKRSSGSEGGHQPVRDARQGGARMSGVGTKPGHLRCLQTRSLSRGKADVTRAADSVAIDPTLPYQRLHKISTCGVGLAATLMGRSRAHAARIMTGFLTCIFVHGAITGWNWSRKRVALRNGKCAFWRRQKRCRGRQTRA
jgi:hypothetical protein